MKHFDLFSGYGGFTLALEKAYVDTNARTKKRGGQSNPAENQDESLQEKSDRIEVGRTGQHSDGSSEQRQLDTVGFSEIDKYASAVLKYRWPNIKNYGNISKIDWATVPDFDLLTGGSPCQDLSIAGKRAGLSGKRSGLFFEYMRAVKEKKPKYFIWENVKGALSSRNGWDFAAVINEMAEAGYALWWQVLNAKDFGVPQNRERIFVIGFRDGSPREVFFERGGAEQNLNEITKNASQGYRVYETDGIATNLASQAGGVGAKTGLYAIPEATKQGYSIAGGGDSINLSQINSKTRRGRVGKGIAQTVDTGMQQHTIQDCRIRRLTPIECERLMGLPDGHTAKGIINGKEVETSDTQRYKLCGNGVVVNVVSEIIKNLIK